MNKIKFISGLAVAFVALGLVFAPMAAPAQAGELEDLQAQVNALLAQIANLQNAGSVIGVHNTNLTLGSTGPAVLNLQRALNADGTYVNTGTGAGAPGYETSFFGPLTQAAVIAYQNKYAAQILAPIGLTAGTGYFGPATRSHMNGNVSIPGPGPTPVPVPVPGVGTEGSITVTLASSPSDGTDVDEGETKDVWAAEVDVDDSNVTITRVDLNFDVRPWLTMTDFELWIDGTLFDSLNNLNSGSFTEITAASDYRARFSGSHTLAEGTNNARIVLRVTGELDSDRSTDLDGITVTLGANSIRYTDTAGLSHEDPSSALSGRDYDFKVLTAGNARAYLSANTPTHRNVVLSTTSETEGVELLRFELKSENQDSAVDALTFAINNDAASADPTRMYTEVWLADSSGDRIVSASTVATSTTFTSIDPDIVLPKDDRVELRLMATVAKVGSGNPITSGDTASSTFTANTTNLVGEDSEYNTLTVTSATINSNDLWFYEAAPTFSNLSVVTTPVENKAYLVNHDFKFTVTAEGGDIYLSAIPAAALATSTGASSSAITQISVSPSSALDSSGVHFGVANGASRTFTWTGSTDNQNGTAGTYKTEITQINWGDSTGNLVEFNQTFDLDDLEAVFTIDAS